MRISIKTKTGRMLLAFALAVTLMLGMGNRYAFAAIVKEDVAVGAISSYETKGISTIEAKKGSATTSFKTPGPFKGSVSVTSTYAYINTNTLVVGTATQSNGYVNTCSVTFNAPSGCRSVKITSTHKVSALNQTWTATTSVVY